MRAPYEAAELHPELKEIRKSDKDIDIYSDVAFYRKEKIISF